MYNATIKKGWGYWDTTYYPKGGCFRRAAEDIRCVVAGKSGNDICVEFNLGQKVRACVDPRGIVLDSAEEGLLK